MAGEFLGNIRERSIAQQAEPLSRFATRFEVLQHFAHLRA
jgi:hypothetical protein